MTSGTDPVTLDVDEAAAALGVSRDHLERHILRLGGHAQTAAADHTRPCTLRRFSLSRSAVAPAWRETGAWLDRPP